jgi:hypothetical protein
MLNSIRSSGFRLLLLIQLKDRIYAEHPQSLPESDRASKTRQLKQAFLQRHFLPKVYFCGEKMASAIIESLCRCYYYFLVAGNIRLKAHWSSKTGSPRRELGIVLCQFNVLPRTRFEE